MKIIDCFNYFDEDMLLDLRLNVLDKYVSKFVICEANFAHKGSSKKLNFDIKNFQKFKDKIIYLSLEEQPSNLKIINNNDDEDEKNSKIIDNCILREEFQRNHLMKKISEFDDNDLILHGDLDEIPNLEKFKYKNKITVFCRKMFYYKFNLFYPNYKWFGTKACKNKHLISPQWLRFVKTKKYSIWRIDTLFSKLKCIDMKIIDNGGWHFCNIKNPEDLHYKMKNFAHHLEYDNSGITLDKLKKNIKDGTVFYDHSSKKSEQDKWKASFKLEKIDFSYLPKYLSENRNKYKDWVED